jgi:ankyrin repeat protein
LLANGANPNLRDCDGDTPLLVCEEPVVFEFLVANGADYKVVNHEQQGIVEKAVEEENEVLLQYFITNNYIEDPNFKIPNFENNEVEMVETE